VGFESIVRNNLVYNTNGNGIQYGAYFHDASNVKFYNNTISLDDAEPSLAPSYGLFITGTSTPGPDIKNNIVSVGRAGYGFKRVIFFNGQAAASSDYNNLFINSLAGYNYTGNYDGTDYVTVVDWWLANGGIYDRNSVGGPPIYTDAANGNLTPLAAVANNVGLDLSPWVTDDINGNLRSTTPDMGAYEYTGPANTKPVAICKNVIVSAGPGCVAYASIDDGSYDPDNDPITLYQAPAGPYPIGVTTVTLGVQDSKFGLSSCTGTVTVVDDVAPIPDIAELPELHGECGLTVTTVPTATDYCAGLITATTTSTLTFDAQGTYVITWRYADGSGNVSEQDQTVVIDDITAPVPDQIFTSRNRQRLRCDYHDLSYCNRQLRGRHSGNHYGSARVRRRRQLYDTLGIR
jgi:hypothetical protein